MKNISPDSPLKYHRKRASRKSGTRADRICVFKETICKYYKYHNRNDLPWRKTKNPYHILVSEIMLQQTQVERVRGKYDDFIRQFPDFNSLSHAPLHGVLSAWQGLGYNRRALALKKIAYDIQSRWEGNCPLTVEMLTTLPGVGKATASAVCAFAFDQPVVFIETNIRRVFIHFFFKGKENVTDGQILPLIEKTLDRKNPRDWYYALMDYGAMLGRSTVNPNRRSRHYQKQSPFRNSDRQLRGMILRAFIKKRYVSRIEIILLLNTEPERADKILQQMMNEGFIRITRKGYTIA